MGQPTSPALSLLSRAAELFGLRRNVALLLAMLVLVGLGEKLFLRYLPLYLRELGAGASVIALLGFLENGLGALYALPGGHFTDRLGHRRALVLFAGMNLVGYALLAVAWWPAVLAATLFCSAWSQLSLPASFSLVAQELPPSRRVMGLAIQGVIRRIPMGVGPVIGGAVFTALGYIAGMRWVLLFAALLTLLAVWLQLRLARPEEPAPPHERVHPRAVWRTFRPELRRLLLSDILIRFCEQIPYGFVSLWVVHRLGRSELEFGYLTAIEMGTAAALYIPVALWVDAQVRRAEAAGRGGTDHVLATERRPFVLTTFALFTAFPAVLFFAGGWWGLVFAFAVRGLKEFGEPARKATIVDLAQQGLKARTVGLYYMVRDLSVACAALAGGTLWAIHPALNLWTAFGFGALGTLLWAIPGHGAEPRPQLVPPPGSGAGPP